MTAEIISKRCGKCKQIKPLSEFYKRPDSKGGFRSNCKICWSKYAKEYDKTEKRKAAKKRYQQSEKGKAAQRRHAQSEKGKAVRKKAWLRYSQTEKGKKTLRERNKRFRIRHPEQAKAIRAVNDAIRTGKLPRPDILQCHFCPAQAEQYHHHKGYTQEHWLDVIPVCIKCHSSSLYQVAPVKSVR